MKRDELAFETVEKAGKYLRQMFGKKMSVQEKDDFTLVSEADKGAEDIIISSAREYFPEDGILTEESEEKTRKSPFRWIFDPLDGTHNFLAGLKEFSCGLALEKEGEIVFGICYFPMDDELFWAKKGKGAFCNNKKIEVSKERELQGQIYFAESSLRYCLKEGLEDINRFAQADCRIRIPGCFHFALTRIARSQGVATTSRIAQPWDIAPAAIILEEAGGMVTDEKGNPWQVNSRNILATNKLVHPEALKCFQ